MSILMDLHTHTKFSVDGKNDIREMCLAAIEKGVKIICFTEHLDFDPLDMGYGYYDYERCSRAVEGAREEFGDRLQILKGLEFGEPHLYPAEFERVQQQDFDFILGSVHCVDGLFVGEPEVAERNTREQIFEKYYAEVLAAVRFGGFDALAHFDLPKRYIRASYSPENLIGEILAEMVKKDIALEINTSPLRKGLSECAPDAGILEAYVRAGGRRVTIGSDGHSCSEIAMGFDYACGLAERAGAQMCVFKMRQGTVL